MVDKTAILALSPMTRVECEFADIITPVIVTNTG